MWLYITVFVLGVIICNHFLLVWTRIDVYGLIYQKKNRCNPAWWLLEIYMDVFCDGY